MTAFRRIAEAFVAIFVMAAIFFLMGFALDHIALQAYLLISYVLVFFSYIISLLYANIISNTSHKRALPFFYFIAGSLCAIFSCVYAIKSAAFFDLMFILRLFLEMFFRTYIPIALSFWISEKAISWLLSGFRQ
jgi:hypothetical protein